MTHDELLELIAANEEFYGDGTNRTPSWTALREVVELLKKYSDGQVRVNEEFNQGILALSNVIKEAIEKELSYEQ